MFEVEMDGGHDDGHVPPLESVYMSQRELRARGNEKVGN